jgi:hypothetical protein
VMGGTNIRPEILLSVSQTNEFLQCAHLSVICFYSAGLLLEFLIINLFNDAFLNCTVYTYH